MILVHGCFWHLHDCPRFKWPQTRQEFWRAKIERNRERDTTALADIQEAGWRVQIVWECALRGVGRRPIEDVLDLCEHLSEVEAMTSLKLPATGDGGEVGHPDCCPAELLGADIGTLTALPRAHEPNEAGITAAGDCPAGTPFHQQIDPVLQRGLVRQPYSWPRPGGT